MPITNKIKFANQEKTIHNTTSSSSYILQGTMLDAGHMTPNNEYFVMSWVNCTSPGADAGATEWRFENGGGALLGSENQFHNTNNSGMYVGHIGQFKAPNPTQNIGIYRKKLTGGVGPEETDYGQCFIIDLSYSGASGQLTSGVDFSTLQVTTSRTVAKGGIMHDHAVNTAGGASLVFASVRAYDSVDTVVLGLYINDVLVSSGSRFTQSSSDVKEILFAGAYNIESGQTVKVKNLDDDNASTNYSYSAVFNLDTGPYAQSTGQMLSWSEYAGSGSWGTKTMDGNAEPSFVVGMGRQVEPGSESGRPAAISLKNNTAEEWLIFKNRSSGEFSPLYFPAVNYSQDMGQRETAVVVGVGTIGNSDEIEMVTL